MTNSTSYYEIYMGIRVLNYVEFPQTLDTLKVMLFLNGTVNKLFYIITLVLISTKWYNLSRLLITEKG